MPVPTFDQFIEPILRHLAAHPEGVPAPAKLMHLMIEHEVGVSSRIIKVPKLDSDYFDEDS